MPPPKYADWKGHEDYVELALDNAGVQFEAQQQGFGARPDLAVLDSEGRRLCNIEVKGYDPANPGSRFNDVGQAETHLAVAKSSDWKELHYVVPDRSIFGKEMNDFVRNNAGHVFVHEEKDIGALADTLKERATAFEEQMAETEDLGGDVPADLAEAPSGEAADFVDTLESAGHPAGHRAVTESVQELGDGFVEIIEAVVDLGKKLTTLEEP